MRRNGLLILLACLLCYGCARDGSFSKEGFYEAMKAIDKSKNQEVPGSDEDEMSFREYEKQRDEYLDSQEQP